MPSALERAGFKVVADETIEPGTAEIRDADGTVRARIVNIDLPTYHMASAWPADAPPCAACDHPAGEHCGKCGCGRGVGTRDECICARYVEALFPCPDCGHVFKYRHELQNHTIPSPACVRQAGVAAAGKYADRPDLSAPLAGMTAGAVQLGQKKRRRTQQRRGR